jgi:hypothetical protein
MSIYSNEISIDSLPQRILPGGVTFHLDLVAAGLNLGPACLRCYFTFKARSTDKQHE